MKEIDYEYQVRDTCKGTVDSKNSRGIYLTLDNGETAFAFSYLDLQRGTKVLCSVKRLQSGDKHTLVTIDSTMLTYAA